jgi:hypothetical protein
MPWASNMYRQPVLVILCRGIKKNPRLFVGDEFLVIKDQNPRFPFCKTNFDLFYF